MPIYTEQFDELWCIVDHYHYSNEERMNLEQKILHIFNQHKGVNGSPSAQGLSLLGLRFHCTYFEYIGCNCFTHKASDMKSTKLAYLRSTATTAEVTDNRLLYELSLENMEIHDFRKYRNEPEISIYWTGKRGLEREADFRILMTITMGPESVGFGTVGELLNALQQWDSMADIVDEPDHAWLRILSEHFPTNGEVGWSDTEMRLSFRRHERPHADFDVEPMWAPDRTFASRRSLVRFIELEKPEARPTALHDYPEFLQIVPRGNGDYVVDYDAESSNWAILFSPRLGIYYRVTVSVYRQHLQPITSLLSVYLLMMHPWEWLNVHQSVSQGQITARRKHFRSLQQFYDDPLVRAASESE